MLSLSLLGKVALITGSSRGIGRAIALRLAREGANIVINYRDNKDAAEKVSEEIKRLKRSVVAIAADVRNSKDIKMLFQTVRAEYNRLDILVNNAAMGVLKPVTEITESKWDLTLETAARSILLCTQEAVSLMRDSGSRVINISSLGSRRYIPGYAALGAAKACIEALTRYLAVELAQYGIIVNAVCGGLIQTDSLNYFPNPNELIASVIQRTPLGRIGTPEDIANVVAFLCSEDASWICGQTIVVDGGFSLS